MALVMTMDSSHVTESTGWDYMAQLSHGANGDTWGPMEITTLTPDFNVKGDYMMWDENPYDGVDSGWRPAALSYDENVGALWGVDGTRVTNAVVKSDGIDYIDIRTVAKSQSAMLWSNAAVLFYKHGVLTQQIDLGSFGADTMLIPGVKEQLLHVTPTNTDNDKVVVSGMVKITAPAGAYPAENDIFSQILIYA